MELVQLILVAVGSGLVASVVTSGVAVHLARKQREHERERDRESVRREVYARYLLFAARLPTRWAQTFSDLPNFDEALGRMIDEKHEIDVILRVSASPRVNSLVGSDSDAAFRAFYNEFTATARGKVPPQPTYLDLEPIALEASRQRWRPFVRMVEDLMLEDVGAR